LKPEESLSGGSSVISQVLNLRAGTMLPIEFHMQTIQVTVPVRWIVIGILLPIAALAIYGAYHVVGGIDSAVGVARRITYGALFAVGFWSASIVLQRWMSRTARPALPPGAPPPPVPTFIIPPPDGPGQYRVRGYDHETHFETEEFVFADSPSNAQMKVELKGVDVAVVERA
jgi:hypothetical protein